VDRSVDRRCWLLDVVVAAVANVAVPSRCELAVEPLRDVPGFDPGPDSCEARARPTIDRTRPDDDGAADADPAATEGIADCVFKPPDAGDDAAGVVLDEVPGCNPSAGVLTGGVWTGAVVVDGVLTGGVVRFGVLTAGVVIGPTVVVRTVPVGTVTDGAVTDGIDTVGVVTVGTPRAPASAA
jgi:hypothetical protein